MADTLWCGFGTNDKLYLQSGQFTSTIKTSLDINSINAVPRGISWDGVNTPWSASDGAGRLFLQSGQFTSTLKTSQIVTSVDTVPIGMSSDAVNSPWVGNADKKLYLTSGKFSSTLKDSLGVSGVDSFPNGISWDGINTPWGMSDSEKFGLQSGQFTSTLKQSVSILPFTLGAIRGMSFDGTDTSTLVLATDDKLFLTSGQFTTTVKDSQSIESITDQPYGIEHGDFDARVPPPIVEPPGVISHHRTAAAPHPHQDWIEGVTKRWPLLHHIFNPEPTPAGVPRSLLQRFVPSQPPHPSQLLGRVRRYPPIHHKFTAVPIPRLPIVSRVVRGPYPPIDAIRGWSKRSYARPPEWIEFQQTYRQRFRVADDSLVEFQLFLGEDAPPDFLATGQPVATSPTLPFSFTPTPPGSGGKLLYIVVREVDKYGLVSFNTHPTLKLIDSGGVELLQDPSPPHDVVILDGATGFLRVLASYFPVEDPNPADTWEIYVTEGSDPVPGVDVPAFSGLMTILGDEAGLSQTVGPFTPGVTAHVIITALRASGPARGNAAVVLQVLALSIDITDADLFGGGVYEQR